jgi:polyhydroxyalkanoate synthesis regulator phasin
MLFMNSVTLQDVLSREEAEKKIDYAPSSETPATEAVRLRSQIDELTRQVTDLHDLRFIHFVIDYIIRRQT